MCPHLLGQETQPAPPQQTQESPGTQETQRPAFAPAPAPPSFQDQGHSGEITEDELKQLLIGKRLFLRNGFQGDSLNFSDHGDLTGRIMRGSYTLSAVEIEKVHLTKHKVELEGARYALHFLGMSPYEDPAKSVERVKITPKKKTLRITIAIGEFTKQKKSKEKPESETAATEPVASSETDLAAPAPAPVTTPAAPQSKVTAATSSAHAATTLREALDRIFAQSLDDKIRAQMPEFWQIYYKAQASGADYHPHDPAVLRSNAVDQQAKPLTAINPGSNEYAQANGIVGQALYQAVIGTDGKAGEIAVIRPIGVGLDENAVAAIRKATFQPATKAGQPVAESLNLAVLFRIYSKQTSEPNSSNNPDEQHKPVLPGPYSAKQP